MRNKITEPEFRRDLRQVLDLVGGSDRVVTVTRDEGDDVALVSADEWRRLKETAHLLGSPANARRLLDALERARAEEGTRMTIEQLRKTVGFEDE